MDLQWAKYQRTDGEWAEFGAFILEASSNGSWVVRHKMGLTPCRTSADIGLSQPGGLDAAKTSCERVLTEILAAPNGADALLSTTALAEQRAITLALCDRFKSMRAAQEEAAREPSERSQFVAMSALEELDARVGAYLKKNRP